ncbi:CHAD domain-containing protein [Terricaulis sp.]|uniref:CYTH and CHAD domain-containing protein n=1 Tax=Terricaulis sp. TaxID=2768686 RepID=UPI0037840A9E
MAREFEIKLEIPAADAGKVMRLPWLWELASGELQPARMVSTYYDTPRCGLRERGISLRVRRIGARRLQTIKAPLSGAALPMQRSEWEDEIAGEEPDLALAEGTALDGLSKKTRRALTPMFEAQVDRSAFPIQSANSAIEVAIDRAQIVSGDASATFCEVELELKRGASSELARIARRIASEVPAALVLKTKADRGYALRNGAAPQPRRAEALAITPAVRVGEALQAIGWSCLRHFVLNADAINNGDTEGVHQMRIGLRRLRAAISTFRQLLDGPETDAVKAELKWLTDELGPARDLDVFLQESLTPLRASASDQTGLEALCEDIAQRREQALDRAKAALASDRYRQLTLRTALWLVASEWSDAGELGVAQPSRRVGAFAAHTLGKRTDKILGKLKRFDDLSPHERHKLRVDVKKLRYASQFFEATFPRSARRRRFMRMLENLQSDLGALNDMIVQERLRDECMAAWTAAEDGANADRETAKKAYAMGYALGQHQLRRASCMEAIRKEARALAELTPYWR